MGELAALGTAILWATTSTLVGSQTTRVPTTVISAIQLITATLVLWLIAAVFLLTDDARGPTPAQAVALVATALIGPGLGDMLYFAGIRMIGVARSFPISMAGSTLFTISLAALFVGEAITVPIVAGAILTIAGISLIATRQQSSDIDKNTQVLRGILIILAAALLWAIATVSLRAATDGVSVPLVSSIRIPAAALFALALARGTGRVLRPGHYGVRSIVTLSIAGVMGACVGSMLYVLAVQEAGASRTAILSATAPLFALPLAAVLLHERITRRVATGTLFSIAGIWLVTL